MICVYCDKFCVYDDLYSNPTPFFESRVFSTQNVIKIESFCRDWNCTLHGSIHIEKATNTCASRHTCCYRSPLMTSLMRLRPVILSTSCSVISNCGFFNHEIFYVYMFLGCWEYLLFRKVGYEYTVVSFVSIMTGIPTRPPNSKAESFQHKMW